MLAANWAPTTHHGVIATKADGNRYWSDYHEHNHELNKTDGTLTINGQIESLPLHYIRRYTFGEDSLGVKLTLTAEKDLKLARLVENVPIARGGWKSRGTEWNAAGVAEGEITSQTFRATDQTGNGVEVSFDRARSLLLVPNGLRAGGWRLLQIGRVEILFPSTLEAGETIDLEYHIRPILAPEVKE